MEHRADPHRREHPRRVECEHIALAARVVGDDHTARCGVLDPPRRLLVEQPSAEAGRGLADDQSVHPHRAGADCGAQARGAELESTGETGGEVIARRLVTGSGRVDQRRELGSQVVVGFGGEPRPGGVEQVGVTHRHEAYATRRVVADPRG